MDAIAWVILAIIGLTIVAVGVSIGGRLGRRSNPEDAIADDQLAQEYDRHRTSAIEMEDRMNGPRNGSL